VILLGVAPGPLIRLVETSASRVAELAQLGGLR
jgi:hypothetical protein